MIIQSWSIHKENLCETTNYLSWMSCTCHTALWQSFGRSYAQPKPTRKRNTITRITVYHHQTNQHRPIHLIIVHRSHSFNIKIQDLCSSISYKRQQKQSLRRFRSSTTMNSKLARATLAFLSMKNNGSIAVSVSDSMDICISICMNWMELFPFIRLAQAFFWQREEKNPNHAWIAHATS